MYDIRYLSRAKQEAVQLRETYSREFVHHFDNWLRYLAEQASDPSSNASIDASELVEQLSDEHVTTKWQLAWRRFATATMQEKLRAILVVLAKRRPPWELRMSSAWFELVPGVSTGIEVFYAVDHPNRRVIFHLFELVDH
jgi:hypothetical protein